jgi:hypothetical protein
MKTEFYPVMPVVLRALYTALAVTVMLTITFMLFEPAVTRGAIPATSTFTIRQEITDEISFLTPATNVTMNGALAGLTGGSATGSTFAVVRTNSVGGYTMTIAFSGTPAMRGETTGGTGIVNYGTTSEPTFLLAASSSAVFAYSVTGSTTADIDQSFRHNGSSLCNQPGGQSSTTNCWMGASTTGFQIVNRSTQAGQGATTTLTFRVVVPSNPVPTVDEDFYTATATLTATVQ